MCKSNASEFRRNSWLFVAFRRNFPWNDDTSRKFPRIFVAPIVLNDNSLRSMIHPEISSDNSFLSKGRCDFSNDHLAPPENSIHCLSIGPEHFWNTERWLQYINDLSNFWARKNPKTQSLALAWRINLYMWWSMQRSMSAKFEIFFFAFNWGLFLPVSFNEKLLLLNFSSHFFHLVPCIWEF